MTHPSGALPPETDRPALYPSWTRWITAGFQRYENATMLGLLIGWTGVIFALWAAAIGAVAGLLSFLFISVFHSSAFGEFLGHAPPAASLFGGLIAAVAGGIFAFGYTYAGAIFTHPGDLFLSVATGGVLAAIIVAGYGALEHRILRLRGFRRLSRDEMRRLAPLIQSAADALNLGALPRFAMTDERIPKAGAGTRTVYLSRGLLTALDDGELRAVIAHELAHWKNADVIGKLFVWATAWPVLLLYEVGVWLSTRTVTVSVGGSPVPLTRGLLPFIGTAIAFPAYFLVNLALVPVISRDSRLAEYRADLAVRSGGLGDQLISALRKLELFEPGNTGWERRLAATHPATELRVEALQQPRPDDDDYWQPELGGSPDFEIVVVPEPSAGAAVAAPVPGATWLTTPLPHKATVPAREPSPRARIPSFRENPGLWFRDIRDFTALILRFTLEALLAVVGLAILALIAHAITHTWLPYWPNAWR